jgi:hypothetical protein
LVVGICFAAGSVLAELPNLGESVLGGWHWEDRQYYAFARDHTGVLSQDGKVFKFRWRTEAAYIYITFLDDAGQELFTWRASRSEDPRLLLIQTTPERPPVEIRRTLKVQFRGGFSAGK